MVRALTLEEYKNECIINLILKTKCFMSEAKDVCSKNTYFISECFKIGYSVHHVVHELTTGQL